MSAAHRARLTGGLLARKGTAVPAGYEPLRPVPAALPLAVSEDAGTAFAPGAVAGEGAAARRVHPRPASGGTVQAARSASNTGNQRTRFTLRLDRDRHLRLRLTAAHLDRSLQDVLTEALDRYLDQVGPEVLGRGCACLSAGGGPR